MSIVDLVPGSIIEKIQQDLLASSVIALKQNDKIATAQTAQSMRAENKRTKEGAEILVYGAGGLKFIMNGKPANTKMPVRKVGNEFELLGSLKDWKAVRGFQGSDFLLARAIARNKKEPIDIAGETLDIFNERYAAKNLKPLLSFSASELGKQIIKNI